MVFFQKKNDRAMSWLKEQNEKELQKEKDLTPSSPEDEEDIIGSENASEEPLAEMQEGRPRKKRKKGMELERHDMTALFLSAILIFMPVAILILGLFALIAWLFF